MAASRAAIAALLERWARGAVDAPGVKAWVEGARAGLGVGDAAAAEVLAELDLLEVHLLTPDDVPALRALLDSDGGEAAVAAWRRHRDAIDLDARSKRLKRDRFYKPFCR